MSEVHTHVQIHKNIHETCGIKTQKDTHTQTHTCTQWINTNVACDKSLYPAQPDTNAIRGAKSFAKWSHLKTIWEAEKSQGQRVKPAIKKLKLRIDHCLLKWTLSPVETTAPQFLCFQFVGMGVTEVSAGWSFHLCVFVVYFPYLFLKKRKRTHL